MKLEMSFRLNITSDNSGILEPIFDQNYVNWGGVGPGLLRHGGVQHHHHILIGRAHRHHPQAQESDQVHAALHGKRGQHDCATLSTVKKSFCTLLKR